jgi:hypothetical protein
MANFGKNRKDPTFQDPSDLYANQKELFIEFEYVFGNPEASKVAFKAFITDYSDEFVSEWNSEPVYGRPDPIHTFSNTTRKITVGWKVPSADLAEARENMAKASQMMRFLYPTYMTPGEASTIFKPPLLRFRFVNLAKKNASQGLLGKPGGFTFAPDLDEGWWDADFDLGASGMTNLLYPKLLTFQCTFDVIHEHHLGWHEGNWEVLPAIPFALNVERDSFPFLSTATSANTILGIKTAEEKLKEFTDNYEEADNLALPPEESAARAQDEGGTSDSNEANAAKAASTEDSSESLTPEITEEQMALENEFFEPQSVS